MIRISLFPFFPFFHQSSLSFLLSVGPSVGIFVSVGFSEGLRFDVDVPFLYFPLQKASEHFFFFRKWEEYHFIWFTSSSIVLEFIRYSGQWNIFMQRNWNYSLPIISQLVLVDSISCRNKEKSFHSPEKVYTCRSLYLGYFKDNEGLCDFLFLFQNASILLLL